MRKIFLFSILLLSASFSIGQTVGISQTVITPQSLLHVHNTSAGQLFQLSNVNTTGGNTPTANSGFNIGIDASKNLSFNQYENATMSFLTNHSERITILGNGLVGIWNTNPTQAKLNVASSNSSQDGIYSEHSSAATGSAYSAIQGVYSGSGYTAAQGNIAYHASTNKTYSLYGTGGDYGAFIQNKVVIGNVHPDLAKNIFDLEVQNTTAGTGNPATIAIRQTNSLTTNGDILGILNFADNSQANPQAQIKILRDAAAGGLGSSDLPTAMTFSTMADGTNTLSERMRISNGGNVGIGINNPHNCALLDISSSTLGILIPHLALTAVGAYAPATGTAVDGLLVYSTSAPTGGAGTGYYYWSTSAGQWISMIDNLSPGKPWLIDGNAGTTAGTNFLGTTDNQDVVFKRNNVVSGLLNDASYNTSWGVKALNSITSGTANTATGAWALQYNTTGNNNTANGVNALGSNINGTDNTAVGYGALVLNTTAGKNVAVGSGALWTQDYSNSGTAWESDNTAVGYNALYFNEPTATSNGLGNAAFGYYALYHNTTGQDNTAVGAGAMMNSTTASQNTACGQNSLYYTTGINNTGLGYLAGFGGGAGTTTGTANTAVGVQALFSYTSGSNNTATGANALYYNTTGNYNTAFGTEALDRNTTGSSNTAVGMDANIYFGPGIGNTSIGMYTLEGDATPANNTGTYNTAVGFAAGSGYDPVGHNPDTYHVNTGSYNTFLGYSSASNATNYTNATAIGAYSLVGASNALVLGSINGVNNAPASTNVGIGINAPTSLLHVVDGAGTFTSGNLVTITGNSLTTGTGLSVSSSSITSGNVLDVEATNATNNSAYKNASIYAYNTGQYANAIHSVTNGGRPNYSSIFAESNTNFAGWGFASSTSNHTINAQISGSGAYSFAVTGYVVDAPHPSGGVLGYYGSDDWGALGYYSTTPTKYSVYGCSTVNPWGQGTGAKIASDSSNSNFEDGIGLGICGGVMGGWIKGNVLGLSVKGKMYSLYVDGQTYTNDIMVQLSNNNQSTERIATYVPTSMSVDVYAKGTAQLQNGEANVHFDENFSSLISKDIPVVITVSPMGECNGLYIVKSTETTEFKVKELNHGTSNVEFSWIAIGVKNGYEKPTVTKELLAPDFDNNMNAVMHNENDTINKGIPIWWNGSELNFDNAPEMPKNN